MNRKLSRLANFALGIGAAIIGFIVYASVRHTMSWTKLVFFWAGCGAIVFFLIYHIFARLPETWQGRPVRRYSLLHRATCAILLIAGVFAATGFSYRTWQSWRLPALYWEPLRIQKTARDHFEAMLVVGNQLYHREIFLQEIQLLTLSDPPQAKSTPAHLQIDSLHLPLQTKPERAPSFVFAQELALPPIEQREIKLLFQTAAALSVYQVKAVYREDERSTSHLRALEQYLVLEPMQAAFIDFAGLAARARQPSHTQQSSWIHAVARCRNPQALGALLELLRVRDVRIQNLVCEALGMLGDPRATPALIDLIREKKNPQAVRALGDLRSKAAIDFLVEILEKEREAFLRAEAAEALGRIAILASDQVEQAIKPLSAVLQYGRHEDTFVQREAMLALARISDSVAVPILLEFAKRSHSGQALRNLLDATSIIGDKWLLPMLGQWLQDWRLHNLDLDDYQMLLDYLVATKHHDMIQILLETLNNEFSPEAQAKIVHALFQLTDKNFGEFQHPVLNLATEKSNRKILQQWQKWWKQAQQDSLFREQVKPVG